MANWRTYVATFMALVLGMAGGAFGGYRYANAEAGREVLRILNRDAATNLASYERIKIMAQNGEDERLLTYVERLMHTESTVIKATSEDLSE
jgi:hypothetical protein